MTLLFSVSVFLFYSKLYPGHLHYHEQFQLFQFTREYAASVLFLPGGVAEYFSRFLIQFFYYSAIAATILAVLFCIVQVLTFRLMIRRSIVMYPLSFIPAIVLWMFMCDENAMPTSAIAIIIAQLATWGVVNIKNNICRYAFTLIAVPVLYLLCGGLALLFPLIAIIYEFIIHKGKITIKVVISVCVASLVILCPIVAHRIWFYPSAHLAFVLHYYRFPQIVPVLAWISMFAVAILPLVSLIMPKSVKSPIVRFTIFGGVLVMVVFLLIFGVKNCSDFDKEEAITYDYLVRMRQWKMIVDKATKKHPDAPMSVTCLNLALAKTGQLGDNMFRFFQNGNEGLIPTFQRDFTSPLPTSEVFYHLGMVNTAQRYTFEAQEANPDFQKSARCYKRLAETNLINGQYEAARKYLKTLQNTLFYKSWANMMLELLGNEEAINSNPEYGWLRKMRFTNDIMFSEAEMDSMLGLLFEETGNNKTAFEYLLAWCLLNKDLQRFYQCYPLGKSLNYDHIPLSYQEALVMLWTQDNKTWDGIPWSISPYMMKRTEQFLSDLSKNMSKEQLQAKYNGSYWVYYLFN